MPAVRDRVALLFRGDRATRASGQVTNPRLVPVADALRAAGVRPEAAVYGDEMVDEVRGQLAGVAAVLVWVDPLSPDGDRARLDALLREVAGAGIWVSAHPDVVLKMGTKEVVYDTRQLGWGSDVRLYRTPDEFDRGFPEALQERPRVLKRHRGNGGIGVWKVELAPDHAGGVTPDAPVLLQSAERRDEVVEQLAFAELKSRFAAHFAGDGRVIDQPFAPRITEGLVRCYLVADEVVGFCRQFPADRSRRVFGLPSAKTMFPPDEPMFATLRARMETEWVPGLQRLVEVDRDSLPVLWDADFLFGDSDDSYILGEINVSSVSPFPEEAVPRLAAEVASRLEAARR